MKVIQTFNTHLMPDDTVSALATARLPERDLVLTAVQQNLQAVPGRLKHVIVYGPRGFGKSFLMRMVQIEIEKLAANGGRVSFILLPEEQINLTRNPRGLLDYLAAKLGDRRQGSDRSWTQSAFKWPKAGEEEALWREAEGRLEQELDRAFPAKAGLAIAVVENFDTLLATAFKAQEDEERLRRWLSRNDNRLMLLATATGTADLDYQRPLFQALQSIRLEPWSQQDCIDYYNRRREFQQEKPLDLRSEAKARAISDFIGGNPRLAQLLSEVLETEDALTVAETMNALADKLADYYRRRIDDLSPLAQGLLDALIRGGEPCSATELASRVGAAQSDIARVMQDLQRGDIFRGAPAPDGRERLFRVVDRVFVHFYRLRQGEAAVRASPLLTILDFLRAFYSREEQLAQAEHYLDLGRHNEAGVFSRLALEGRSGATFEHYLYGFRWRLRSYLLAAPKAIGLTADEALVLLDQNPEHAHNMCKAGNAQDTAVAAAIARAVCAQAESRMGLAERAKSTLETALAAAEDDPAGIVVAGAELANFLGLGRRKAGHEILLLVAAQAEAEIPSSLRAMVLCARSYVLSEDNATTDTALAVAEEAANIAETAGDQSERAEAMRLKAMALLKLRRYEEAIAVADHAAALTAAVGDRSEQATAMLYQAWSLGALGRHKESIAAADQGAALAAAIGNQSLQANAMRHKAWSLRWLGRHEEAIAAADQAIALTTAIGDQSEQAVAMYVAGLSLEDQRRDGEAWDRFASSFDLAIEAKHIEIGSRAASQAVRVARRLPRPEVVDVFERWIASQEEGPKDSDNPSPSFYFGELLAAVACARAWPALDRLLTARADWISTLPKSFPLFEVGTALAETARAEGRAVAFSAIAEALRNLPRLLSGPLKAQRSAGWLGEIVSPFADGCRDPGLLRDVAGLITDELTPDAAIQRLLLLHLADFDESGDAKMLARHDPDIATWIRLIRNLPEEKKTVQRSRRPGRQRRK